MSKSPAGRVDRAWTADQGIARSFRARPSWRPGPPARGPTSNKQAAVSQRRGIGEKHVGGFAAPLDAQLPFGEGLCELPCGGVGLAEQRVTDPRVVELQPCTERFDGLGVSLALQRDAPATSRPYDRVRVWMTSVIAVAIASTLSVWPEARSTRAAGTSTALVRLLSESALVAAAAAQDAVPAPNALPTLQRSFNARLGELLRLGSIASLCRSGESRGLSMPAELHFLIGLAHVRRGGAECAEAASRA